MRKTGHRGVSPSPSASMGQDMRLGDAGSSGDSWVSGICGDAGATLSSSSSSCTCLAAYSTASSRLRKKSWPSIPPRRADTPPGLKYRASFRPCGPRASSFHPSASSAFHASEMSFVFVGGLLRKATTSSGAANHCAPSLPSIDPPGASNLPLRCLFQPWSRSASQSSHHSSAPVRSRPSMQWSLTWSWTASSSPNHSKPSCP